MTIFIRYCIVALLAYGIDFGGYILLLSLSYSPVIANSLIKIIAAIFGFYAHRFFTYSIRDSIHIKKHAVRYFGLALLYTPVSSLLLYCIMIFFPNPIISKAAADISLALLMFWITSKFAFIKAEPT